MAKVVETERLDCVNASVKISRLGTTFRVVIVYDRPRELWVIAKGIPTMGAAQVRMKKFIADVKRNEGVIA